MDSSEVKLTCFLKKCVKSKKPNSFIKILFNGKNVPGVFLPEELKNEVKFNK